MFDEPTADEIQATIEMGSAAKALLDSLTFAQVVNDLTNTHVSAMLSTPVGETGRVERERHHALHNALSEIVVALKTREFAGEQAQQALQEPVDE